MKYIRDRIYDYVPVSRLEVELLKQPEILRLHRILQNSTVHQTYPNNRATRFSHSLGAMHLAGLQYKSLINNSSGSYQKKLHEAAKEFINGHSEVDDLKNCRAHLVSVHSKSVNPAESGHVSRKDFYLVHGWSMKDDVTKNLSDENLTDFDKYYNTINNIVFQAIRLAALVHDIGHPPYSHVTEFALNDMTASVGFNSTSVDPVQKAYTKLEEAYLEVIATRTISKDASSKAASDMGVKRGELHEMVGIVLINELFKNSRITSEHDTKESTFWTICLATAVRILSVDQMGHYRSSDFKDRAQITKDSDLMAWHLVSNFVAGQVDSDRLDYLMRDPRNSGISDFGSFDVPRIINGIIPVKLSLEKDIGVKLEERKTSEDELFVLGFHRRSLSALADLFFDRMRQYRWIVNHHNVVRTDLAFTRLIFMLASIWNNETESSQIHSLLRNQHFDRLWQWTNKDLLSSFRYLDDSWLEHILSEVRRDLATKRVLTSVEDELLLYLELLLDRKYEYFLPVWKRVDGYLPFAKGFCKEFSSLHESYFTEEGSTLGILQNRPFNKFLSSEKSKLKLGNEAEMLEFTNLLLGYWKKSISVLGPYSVMREVEVWLNKHSSYSNFRFHFCLKTSTPYREVLIRLEDGSFTSMDKMSSLTMHLNDISSKSLKLYCFVSPIPERRDTRENQSRPSVSIDEIDRTKLGTEFGKAFFKSAQRLQEN